MPTTQRSGPPARVPDGIVAVVLACAIAFLAGQGIRTSARHLADRHLALITTADVPFKYQTLTFQRAALASGHVLPIYGSSELVCCGGPFRPTEVFASHPTGFDVLAVGRAGTGDLFFAQILAALGSDLRNRRVVISDSPAWFASGNGPKPDRYEHNFLPEAGYDFIFEAPIPLPLRELGARRMLAYPGSLRDDPLLRRAVEDLAHPTRIDLAGYAALAPLGRVAAWALEVRDAARTAAYFWRMRRGPAGLPPRRGPLDWTAMAARGTRLASKADTTNPFGFSDDAYHELRERPHFRAALAMYGTGRTNRNGEVLPPPRDWERNMTHSAEWEDMRLVLGILRAAHARPLVWTMPLPGAFFNYTAVSAPARLTYYERYGRASERAGIPWLDFRAHDEDRYFVTDPASHLSARGWVFADRALDVFWHTGSVEDIRAALATLAREVPAPEPPRELADAAARPAGVSD